MKKLFTLGLLCGLALSLNAQYMKLDASFYSEALDEIKKVDIYLPADYYENLEQDYAVIYYLHGAGGDENEGHTFALRYYALHSMDTSITSPPAIFVSPDGSCEPYSGSDYLNSELYGNFGDYTTFDLIEFIENNFRAKPIREFRFVCGTSMGGFGSAFHATDKPELFRASFPFIGFPAVSDSGIINWANLIYEENESYHDINYSAGINSKLILTIAGGFSPNMSLPNFVELPWDSTGALIDSVVDKWNRYDASRKVRDFPNDLEMAFFLGCGTQDYMGTYPLNLQFKDSLDFYEIPCQYNFFEGGHVDDFITWQKGFHWMDSIINYSFQTEGVEIIQKEPSTLSLYPNPANNTIHISLQSKNFATATISIYNHLGQKMGSEIPFETIVGNNELSLDISSFKNGIYFIQLSVNGRMITKKFIKY